MSTFASRFWADCTRYHSIAKTYERGIEVVHPDRVNCNHFHILVGCGWCAQGVDYYEYRGEAI